MNRLPALALRQGLLLAIAVAAFALAQPLLQLPGSLYTAFDRSVWQTGLWPLVGGLVLASLACAALQLVGPRTSRAVAGLVMALQLLALLQVARMAWLDLPEMTRTTKMLVVAALLLLALAWSFRAPLERVGRMSEALAITLLLAYALHPGFFDYVLDFGHGPAAPAPGRASVAKAGARPETSARKVVVLLLDELDSQIASREGFFDRQPVLDLARRGFLTLDMTPGGPETLRSVPAMLSGRRFAAVRRSGPGYLVDVDGQRWDERSPGLFHDLDAARLRYSVVGFYHDYCHIAPRADACVAEAVDFFAGWDESLLRLLRGRSDFQYPYSTFLRQWSGIQLHLRSEALEALRRGESDVYWFHLNVPHPPVAETGVQPRGLAEDYRANLVLAARIVGEVSAALKQASPDYALVITSDHWLREQELWHRLYDAQLGPGFGQAGKDPKQHGVPLLVAFGTAGQDNSPVNGGRADALSIRRLVLALAQRRVNSPREAANFLAR